MNNSVYLPVIFLFFLVACNKQELQPFHRELLKNIESDITSLNIEYDSLDRVIKYFSRNFVCDCSSYEYTLSMEYLSGNHIAITFSDYDGDEGGIMNIYYTESRIDSIHKKASGWNSGWPESFIYFNYNGENILAYDSTYYRATNPNDPWITFDTISYKISSDGNIAEVNYSNGRNVKYEYDNNPNAFGNSFFSSPGAYINIRSLLPVISKNNVTKITWEGLGMGEINIEYGYDNQNYPIISSALGNSSFEPIIYAFSYLE